MIWNFIVIIIVTVLVIILARRLPDARKRFVTQTVSSKEDANLFTLIAQADDAFERGHFQKAEDLYVQAAATDPDNKKIYSKLGAIYLEKKNYYDARDAFLQAAKLEPANASRYVNLGLAYLGLKDYFKAMDAFKKALDLDKKNSKYRKLFEKAEKYYQKEKK